MLWTCRRLTVKPICCFSIFDMMLKAIFCVQHFCSFGAMLFNVNLLIKTDSTVIGVPCMLEHVCYEPFSVLSEIHTSKTRFKQINENLRLNVYACMFWEPVYKISYCKCTYKNGFHCYLCSLYA